MNKFVLFTIFGFFALEKSLEIYARQMATFKTGNGCGIGSKIYLNAGNDLPCSLSKAFHRPNVKARIGKPLFQNYLLELSFGIHIFFQHVALKGCSVKAVQ